MPRKPDKKPKGKPAKKPTPRVTARKVQASESLPPPKVPDVQVRPEVDEDPWDLAGLTIRQRKFVEAIIGPAGGNATKAARLAGYRDDNYDALRRTASENLSKPHVSQAIRLALARQKLDPEWAKQRLASLALSDMSNFLSVDENGEATLDFLKAAAVGAIGQIKEYAEEGIKDGGGGGPTIIKRKIKLHDPAPALANMLKLFGLLIERHDHTTGGKPLKLYADIDDGDDAAPVTPGTPAPPAGG